VKPYTTGWMLETKEGDLIFQQRDDFPHVFDAGKISTFGGHGEKHELPADAALREILEETELNLDGNIDFFATFITGAPCQDKRDHHVFLARGVDPTRITVHEGTGYVIISKKDDLDKINLAPFARYLISLYWGSKR
jgi:8-oxo-dGTP diphosphatase